MGNSPQSHDQIRVRECDECFVRSMKILGVPER